MDLDAYPREPLRRKLIAVGIPRERHRMSALLEMLPVQLSGKPYDEFDADSVAEVLIYLIGRGLIAVPGPEVVELNLRWGDRVCHFYRSEEELISLVVPYFRQGLAEGERCVWLAPDEPSSTKARHALADMPELEVKAAEDWNHDLDGWTREEQRALVQGYNGVRVCGERLKLEDRTAALRIKALCTYDAERTDRAAVPGIIREHHAALVKHRQYWQRIPTTDAAAAATILSALIN